MVDKKKNNQRIYDWVMEILKNKDFIELIAILENALSKVPKKKDALRLMLTQLIYSLKHPESWGGQVITKKED